MKANAANLLNFLKSSTQFMIPIYQRTYSWEEHQCQQLWDDIVRVGENSTIPGHFIGSVVYILESDYLVSSMSPLFVIDGQQRLTTISLLIEALARKVGDTEPKEGFSAQKLRNYYLINHLESGDKHFKLLLTRTDKRSYLSLISQQSWPDDYSNRIKNNYDFFVEKINSYSSDILNVCNGINKLMIVDVSLNRDQDNPQLIFESLNSTGRKLSQADLIRNYVLMGLDKQIQDLLYENHWRPMEVSFGQEAYGTHFDSFMRHYLTLKTRNIPRVDEVYDAFKIYAQKPSIAEMGIEYLVSDIHEFADYYCAMALGKEKRKDLALAFHDLRELGVDVAYPLLLELYHDFDKDFLSEKDFIKAIKLIESYIFRRNVCKIPTNSLNKTFATFHKSLKKNRYLESIKAHFILLPSYRRFPSNSEFTKDIKTRDLYNFRNRSYWLRRFENFGRKELVPVEEYTIEHIMPQNPELSEWWCNALGDNWQELQEKYLHTLGNLTLTGYNPEYSDKSFPEKRDMQGGFKDSPIKLNQSLRSLNTWNTDYIEDRASELSELSTKVWNYPILQSDILEQYKEKPMTDIIYSIDDHPNLVNSGLARDLYLNIREKILVIDPCVSEEFLKVYVAFKAETNFCDIIPQRSRLLLSINLDFHELKDPRGIARDVANLGRWGNGKVEVFLEHEQDISYVMGLIRQAFEKQMGNGDLT